MNSVLAKAKMERREDKLRGEIPKIEVQLDNINIGRKP
jgi:hypothetical protein